MPKLKTKSSVKKRFRLTGTGKVITAHAKKRHGMRKLSPQQRSDLRGTTIMADCDAKIVRRFMPYGL